MPGNAHGCGKPAGALNFNRMALSVINGQPDQLMAGLAGECGCDRRVEPAAGCWRTLVPW